MTTSTGPCYIGGFLNHSPSYGQTKPQPPKRAVPTPIAQIATITPFHRIWDSTPQMYTEEANYSMRAVRDLYDNGYISRKSYEAAMLAIRDKAEGSSLTGMSLAEPAPRTTNPDIPVGTGADDAEAVFQAVRAMTGDGRIRGYVGRKATMAAVQAHGRVSDILVRVAQNLDDIVQDLTLGATERILRYRDNEDFYPVYADTGQTGAGGDDVDIDDDGDEAPNLDIYVWTPAGPVIGWYVRIGTPCGVCDKCTKSRKCPDKSYRWEFFTVRRVVFAMVQAVAKRHFRPDMDYLDLELAASDGMRPDPAGMRHDVPIDLFGKRLDRTSLAAPDVQNEGISPQLRKMARKVVKTLDEAELSAIHPVNGKMTADAGNVWAMVMGHVPTDNGRREAFRKIRRIQAEYAETSRND